MQRHDPFRALKISPLAIGPGFRLTLPLDTSSNRPPSACCDAYVALLLYTITRKFGADDCQLNPERRTHWETHLLPAWPAAWRWVAFFHPRSGNVAIVGEYNILGDFQTFYKATCDMEAGRRLVMDTDEALPLLLDLWLNYFEYIPNSSSLTCDWTMHLHNDYYFAKTIARLREHVPRPQSVHLAGKRIIDGLVAAAGSSLRKLYRKAISERLLRIVARQCVPAGKVVQDAIRTVFELVQLCNDLRFDDCPRDVVYAVVKAWQDTADLVDGESMALLCLQLLALFHVTCASDHRYLAWCVRAGSVTAVLRLVRGPSWRDGDGNEAVTIRLIRWMRAQMVHRDFLRVIRRHAGSAMVVQSDDPPYVQNFIVEYGECIQELDAVDAWMKTYPCLNRSMATWTEHKRKCVCGMAYYCSKECQIQHWPIHRHVCSRYRNLTRMSSRPFIVSRNE
ncbi:hypothetical protein BD626DRAFT_175068 [Schizophyllum amplum]|uniref:MYND-type domain-containing protein n=1 Tax=Schizophyllum amplum TaxID=97359 RepID=A0A550C2N5_9AGAR|nr:hypothetical protein BD626DRAFT_175068 [Auriculariopsis ampla]